MPTTREQKRERKACFAHAKAHVIEAIADVIHDEHHSVMEVDGVTRLDMQRQTEIDLIWMLKFVKSLKVTDVPEGLNSLK